MKIELNVVARYKCDKEHCSNNLNQMYKRKMYGTYIFFIGGGYPERSEKIKRLKPSYFESVA